MSADKPAFPNVPALEAAAKATASRSTTILAPLLSEEGRIEVEKSTILALCSELRACKADLEDAQSAIIEHEVPGAIIEYITEALERLKAMGVV